MTEGDSAKALAISGLSVVGRDYFGVFPLRGKLLNARDCSQSQIMGNSVRDTRTRCSLISLALLYRAQGPWCGSLSHMAPPSVFPPVPNAPPPDLQPTLHMQEIKALVEILGLRFGTEYKDTKSLRYGHVMVMAD